jgi:hypothetical protein
MHHPIHSKRRNVARSRENGTAQSKPAAPQCDAGAPGPQPKWAGRIRGGVPVVPHCATAPACAPPPAPPPSPPLLHAVQMQYRVGGA